MKIGKLEMHCGNCPIIDYCTEPYESPMLCGVEGIADMDTDTYKEIAALVTEDEISDKLNQYEQNNIEPWSDERAGAILDIVLDKIYGNGGMRNAD